MRFRIFMLVALLLSVAISSQAQTRRKAPVGRCGLSIEAGLVFQSGDVKPVARTSFYLLDKSLAQILRDAGLKERPSTSFDPDSDLAYEAGFGTAALFNLPYYAEAAAAMKPHIVQTITTDFHGKGRFSQAPCGTYYVMGFVTTPQAYAIWDLKVALKGTKTQILDQKNAAFAG